MDLRGSIVQRANWLFKCWYRILTRRKKSWRLIMKNNRRCWAYIASLILIKVISRNTTIFIPLLNFTSTGITLKIWIAISISISTKHTHFHHRRSNWPVVKYFPSMSSLLGFFSTFVGDIVILILFFIEVRVFKNASIAWCLINVTINILWRLFPLCVCQFTAMILRYFFWLKVHL